MASPERLEVNFFKPRTKNIRSEVRVASTVLIIWFVLSFGIPIFIWMAGMGDPTGLGRSFLTEISFLGFPLHYWLLAQGCTIGYVLLCKLYCVLWSRRVTRR